MQRGRRSFWLARARAAVVLAVAGLAGIGAARPQEPGAPLEAGGWRGPARDGRVAGFSPPALWPEKLREEWRVVVGEGHSSPVAGKERVYLLVRQGDREVVLCLAHKDGKELWRADHPTPYKVDPAARAHGKGPKATPALGGGRLYTFSISGILSCFDAEKGALVWRQEFTRDFPGTSPLYGAAASPLLDGGLCIVPVGGHDRGALAAFDAGTGEKKWSWTGDGPGYSSPIAAELGGKRQAIVLLQNRVVGVAAASGALLWSLPFKTPYDQNIVTPVLHGETVIYSGLEQGTTAVRLVPRGSSLVPEEAWSNPDVFFYMSSPVVEGNRLFGMTSRRRGIFYALDAGSGKVIWESPPGLGENVAVLSAGGLVWLLTTGAELILLEANASSYAPLRKYKVSGGPTWAHPAILPDRVLIKDDKSLASWTWKM